nr:MAG TPA: hypothetical protein [Caudoviricetes sp.]
MIHYISLIIFDKSSLKHSHCLLFHKFHLYTFCL